jgi:nucleotide-binding universal stress UspA family protein
MERQLILCPIDFSEFSARAYHYALSLAGHYDAELVAHHTVELWRYPSLGFAATVGAYDEFCQSVREKSKQQLQDFVGNAPRREIYPRLLVDEGTAPDSILAFAEAHKPNLIVMGTHGRRGYDRLMLGSVTDRVMRKAPCPVLAVCCTPPEDSVAGDSEPDHVHRLRRILFCADFSENSARALNYAISATAEYDAELTLLHLLEDAPSAPKTEEAIAAATEQLNRLIPPEKRKTLKIKTEVRIGKPYQEIIQFAREAQIDMTVMGVRGRGALDLSVFGSTTYRVVQLGPCPVLVHV